MLSTPASLGSRDLALWLWGQELSAASFEMLGVSRITGLGLRKGLVPPCALLVLMFAKRPPRHGRRDRGAPRPTLDRAPGSPRHVF